MGVSECLGQLSTNLDTVVLKAGVLGEGSISSVGFINTTDLEEIIWTLHIADEFRDVELINFHSRDRTRGNLWT